MSTIPAMDLPEVRREVVVQRGHERVDFARREDARGHGARVREEDSLRKLSLRPSATLL